VGQQSGEKINPLVSIPANHQTRRLILAKPLLFAAETTKAPVAPTPPGLFSAHYFGDSRQYGIPAS